MVRLAKSCEGAGCQPEKLQGKLSAGAGVSACAEISAMNPQSYNGCSR